MGVLRDRVTPSSPHIPSISDTAELSKLRGTRLRPKCINYREVGWVAWVDISYQTGWVRTPVNTWLRNVNEDSSLIILNIDLLYFYFAGMELPFSLGSKTFKVCRNI